MASVGLPLHPIPIGQVTAPMIVVDKNRMARLHPFEAKPNRPDRAGSGSTDTTAPSGACARVSRVDNLTENA